MKKNVLSQSKPAELLKYTTIIIIILWFWTPVSYWLGDYIPIFEIESRADYGNMFGGVNAFFAGMALIGVVFTTYIQQKELKDQNETLRVQQFEHSFFSMLKVHNDIVNSMRVRTKEEPYDVLYSGRDTFKYLLRKLKEKFHGESVEEAAEKILALEEGYDLTRTYYERWWQEYRTKLSHYFRFLYHLISFVEIEFPGELTDKEKREKYIKMVRAQLSDQEQAILFYNCLSKTGEGFRELTERYNLIKHVPDELLFDKDHKRKYYPDLFSEDIEDE